MMLSKYSAILFVFMLLIFIVLKRRDIFLNRNFYFAVLVASIVVSHMLWWNYQNEWISFAFQLEHGSSKTFELYPNLFLEFFAGQFGIFSPVFTAILFYFLVKERLYFKEEKLFFLSLSIITILLFFFYKSFFTRMELNYAAPAYIGGAILTAYIFERYKLVRTFKVGLIIAITFTIIGRLGFLFYLEIVQDRMYGNREAVQLLQTHSQKGDSFYGDHLTIAAYLNYYLKERPETDVILESRFSQYDMWREDDFLKDGLVLTRDPEEVRLSALYNDIKLIDSITVKKGIKGEKTLYIYRVTNVK